jgi:hypothetical protein
MVLKIENLFYILAYIKILYTYAYLSTCIHLVLNHVYKNKCIKVYIDSCVQSSNYTDLGFIYKHFVLSINVWLVLK